MWQLGDGLARVFLGLQEPPLCLCFKVGLRVSPSKSRAKRPRPAQVAWLAACLARLVQLGRNHPPSWPGGRHSRLAWPSASHASPRTRRHQRCEEDSRHTPLKTPRRYKFSKAWAGAPSTMLRTEAVAGSVARQINLSAIFWRTIVPHVSPGWTSRPETSWVQLKASRSLGTECPKPNNARIRSRRMSRSTC